MLKLPVLGLAYITVAASRRTQPSSTQQHKSIYRSWDNTLLYSFAISRGRITPRSCQFRPRIRTWRPKSNTVALEYLPCHTWRLYLCAKPRFLKIWIQAIRHVLEMCIGSRKIRMPAQVLRCFLQFGPREPRIVPPIFVTGITVPDLGLHLDIVGLMTSHGLRAICVRETIRSSWALRWLIDEENTAVLEACFVRRIERRVPNTAGIQSLWVSLVLRQSFRVRSM